jgi:hypothetical protein
LGLRLEQDKHQATCAELGTLDALVGCGLAGEVSNRNKNMAIVELCESWGIERSFLAVLYQELDSAVPMPLDAKRAIVKTQTNRCKRSIASLLG